LSSASNRAASARLDTVGELAGDDHFHPSRLGKGEGRRQGRWPLNRDPAPD
jgi:hypothetical protein